MGKEVDQWKHAKRRCFDRFGLVLSEHDKRELIKLAQNPNTKFIRRDSDRISVFEITYRGTTMHMVYDRVRKTPVTFLYTEGDPRDVYGEFRWGGRNK